eukprot:gene14052-19991_t
MAVRMFVRARRISSRSPMAKRVRAGCSHVRQLARQANRSNRNRSCTDGAILDQEYQNAEREYQKAQKGKRYRMQAEAHVQEQVLNSAGKRGQAVSVCGICGDSGHNRRTCRSTVGQITEEEVQPAVVRRRYRCSICGDDSHNSQLCAFRQNVVYVVNPASGRQQTRPNFGRLLSLDNSDERAERERLQNAIVQEEQHAAARAAHAQAERERLAAMPKEQRAAARSAHTQVERARRAAMSEEQRVAARAAHAQSERERVAAMSEEQRAVARVAHAQAERARRAAMSEGDLATRRIDNARQGRVRRSKNVTAEASPPTTQGFYESQHMEPAAAQVPS